MNLSSKPAAGGCGPAQTRSFLHAGPTSHPRMVSLEAQPEEELRITLPTGTLVGPALRTVLQRYGQRGGVAYLCSGSARTLQYHRTENTGDIARPYGYGTAHVLDGVITFITGTITIGQDQEGKPLLHCHAGFLDSGGPDGTIHGGHVLLDTVEVGEHPLILRLCLFSRGAFVIHSDAETHFSLLQPAPMEPR